MCKVPSANVMGKTLKVCPVCKEEKRLWSYHEPKQNVMLDVCKKCHKKQLNKELFDIVLSVLTKKDV